MPYPFVIADVFTDTIFGGNQLAVVTDATGMTGEQMQAVAREFNFAESTFVLPPETPEGTRRVRIFTPMTELRFAGHPTVGTAAVLAHLGKFDLQGGVGRVILEEGVGPVSVDIDIGLGRLFTRLTLPGAIEKPGEAPDADHLAAALSVPREAILESWFASVGIPFCLIRLPDPATVDAAALDRAAWTAHLKDTWAPQLFLYSGDADWGELLHARMFAPAFGIDEDPATGSAAATLAGCVAARSPGPDCSVTLSVAQGVAIGRPSRIEAFAEKRGGTVENVGVGGETVIFASGHLELPG